MSSSISNFSNIVNKTCVFFKQKTRNFVSQHINRDTISIPDATQSTWRCTLPNGGAHFQWAKFQATTMISIENEFALASLQVFNSRAATSLSKQCYMRQINRRSARSFNLLALLRNFFLLLLLRSYDISMVECWCISGFGLTGFGLDFSVCVRVCVCEQSTCSITFLCYQYIIQQIFETYTLQKSICGLIAYGVDIIKNKLLFVFYILYFAE